MDDASLHPQARAFLDRLADERTPPPHALSVESSRRAFADLVTGGPGPDVGAIDEFSIAGPGGPIPLRTYVPEGVGPHPVLVYAHGGGWVRGDLDTADALCRSITSQAGCLTVSVDYRRPPESPFPAALRDCLAVVEWLSTDASAIGGDPERIAVGGDSAGGNLAAATALALRDRSGPALAHQLLLYPVLDHTFDTESYRRLGDEYPPTRETMEWYWDQYLRSAMDGRHPYASPLRAHDLGGLPSATVLTAGFDPLRDEGRDYAERLDEAGVSTDHVEYEGMIHGFLSFPEALDHAIEGREMIAERLRHALGT